MSDAAAPASSAEGAAAREQSARILAIVVYALYSLALTNGITAVVGVVIAYLKRGDARGTVYADHFAVAISTFWIVLIGSAALMTATLELVFGTVAFYSQPVATTVWHPGVLALLPLLWLGFAGLVVFYLYRTIRGLIRAIEGRSYR